MNISDHTFLDVPTFLNHFLKEKYIEPSTFTVSE